MSQADPIVWFAIPSANRQAASKHLPVWRERGYRIAIMQDRERFPVPEADLMFMPYTEYLGWGASVSILSRMLVAAGADIVVTGGDDMLPDPTKSAKEIGREFMQRFPDGMGIMQPIGDDLPGTDRICGSPWLGRGWIIRGYDGSGPVCTSYKHFFVDQELHEVATRLGILWQRPDLCHRHNHWSRTGGRNAIGERLQNYWAGDEAEYERRRAIAFAGSSPLHP